LNGAYHIDYKLKKYIYISLFILFCSCSKEQRNDCFTSAGPEAIELRVLENFSNLRIEDKLIVVLVQDSSRNGEVEIRGPKNLIPQITTELRDGELVLRNTNTCNFVRSFDIRFHIKVFFEDIESLNLDGAAECSNEDTLHLNRLIIRHDALSDLNLTIDIEDEIFLSSFNSAQTFLKGRTKVFKGSIEEVSSVDARELTAEEVLLDHHSPIDSYIHGTRIIFVKIFNKGNFFYVAEPSQLKEVNYRRSSGDLILLK